VKGIGDKMVQPRGLDSGRWGEARGHVHGSIIPNLNKQVEAEKQAYDWGSIACSPSVEMPRDCTKALEMKLT